ncbi:hypothetical protein LWI28_024415 [Acer negundo]|uniref:DUF4220 domain-containing protein n=1 Tax=Acer negundo TaxID=4023 RepID=A0AAD5NJQ5_ACENE|nr:hypothetical protein LWI28_024415 [Acer negundo]
MDANTQLSAFWAPFLVLHLGGPDTVTAFALEDNELWLRHLLGLFVQTGMALSVFLMSWTASSLSILSSVMFFVGIVKYAERTWVLRSASIQQRRKSSRSPLSCFEEYAPMRIRSEEDRLRLAKDMLYICTCAFVDGTMEEYVRNSSFIEFSKPLAPEYAFEVIEIELGLIYDMLYTKAPLLYTCGGIVLRLITFSLTCLVMVLFPVIVDKHKYSMVDLWITYLLIIVAIIHDIYAALLLVLSDRFAAWLIEYNRDSIFKAWLIKRLPSTRWSNNMSQYSLLQLSFTSTIAMKCIIQLRDHFKSLIKDGHLKDYALKGGSKQSECQENYRGGGQERKSPRKSSLSTAINTVFGGPYTSQSKRGKSLKI